MPHTHLDATLSIQAPAHIVFDRMGDLSRFNDWNPFPSMDPTTTSSHEGPASGPGAIFNYEGKRLGRGRMEVAAVSAPHRIDIDMTFWRGNSVTRSQSAFVIKGTGDVTEVHWTFDEDRGLGMYLLGKLLFDRMMTNTFRDGLQKLKALVEAGARAGLSSPH
jgi:carbon monoxide dehydrogenase subunit G